MRLEKLVSNGIEKEMAEVLLSTVPGIRAGKPVDEQTKNKVYKVMMGKLPAICKILKNKHEAEMECFVGQYFLNDLDVAMMYIQKPLPIWVNDEKRYLIIQEDVSYRTDLDPNYNLETTSTKYYIDTWLKNLAKIHVRATNLANKLGNWQNSQRLNLDVFEDRIRNAQKIMHVDLDLRAEVICLNPENKDDFIHEDIRKENHIYQYCIDWGHAGRGNVTLDIGRVLLDYEIETRPFCEEDYKGFITTYLTEKAKLQGKTRFCIYDLERTYRDFNLINLIFTASQCACLINKAGRCSARDVNNIHYLIPKIKYFEKAVRKMGVQT